MMLLPFSACDGILEGIYDSPAASDSNELGFIRTDPSTHSGTIYIDATDYRRWTFIDFHTQKVDSVNVTDSDQKEPEEWDIAVHRYDAAVHMRRCVGVEADQVGAGLGEGLGQRVHRLLALRQHFQHLQPLRAGQGLAHASDLLVQKILERSVVHDVHSNGRWYER